MTLHSVIMIASVWLALDIAAAVLLCLKPLPARRQDEMDQRATAGAASVIGQAAGKGVAS